MRDFVPFRPFRNAHVMTIASGFWPRKFARLPQAESRLFTTELGTQVRGECHWQQDRRAHPTIVVLHGLEGSSESGYILGTAERAWLAGFNVVRLNQRNCGGTEKLSATLYHSGLSGDIRAVLLELIEREKLSELFAAGFSMGGNLVLKMAGEFGEATPREVRGFVAIAPAFDLAACADALCEPRNIIYQRHFVRRLKARMRRKAKLFPDKFVIGDMKNIRTVRDFDDEITARFCGFESAADYYAKSSANRLLSGIRRPTLILTAQDDPVVPFKSFTDPAVAKNPLITLEAPRHGGHCSFISEQPGSDRFWAESRIVEFCWEHRTLNEANTLQTSTV
jgi:predicted alpha/beta-fold hydrolase